MFRTALPDLQPTDPPFLFVILLAARKAGDRMLESLARDWLAKIGVTVQISRDAACLRSAPVSSTEEPS